MYIINNISKQHNMHVMNNNSKHKQNNIHIINKNSKQHNMYDKQQQ